MNWPLRVPPRDQNIGLSFWMGRVIREYERVRRDMATDPVHDLRVALRRCRSIADGYMTLDPNKAWREMKKSGRALFRKLGELRDTQVMAEWAQRLAGGPDQVGAALTQYLTDREGRLKEDASQAIGDFSRKQWISWRKQLTKRASRIGKGESIFEHLAVQRLYAARELHRQALRNRTQVAFHRLRIGIKRFRYTVENFLPRHYEQWGADLREVQDLLGEVQDLNILWRTAVEIGAVQDDTVRSRWRSRIQEERAERLSRYRRKMVGKTSLWRVWLAGLPSGSKLEEGATNWLRAWASFRDPDFAHSEHVARLALQMYDGLNRQGMIASTGIEDTRTILRLAAILHNVGLSEGGKQYHKATYRMLREIEPPLGCPGESFRRAALVARYHRGALPRLGHREYSRLSREVQQEILLTAGILRLAVTLDFHHDERISRVEIRRINQVVVIYADGYIKDDPLARKLASARFLLESSLGVPIVVQGGYEELGRREMADLHARQA